MKILCRQEKTYSKQTIIDAIQRMFGMTKREALEYYNKAEDSALYEIVDGYLNNAKRSFYED